MAISWKDSASNTFVKAGSTPQSSRNSSSQSKDSSASWSPPPSLEINSSSERAREASRTCAATEVPERSNCLPSTRTSSRPLGSLTNSRIVAAANFFVRSRNSTGSRPWFISAFCFPNFCFSPSDRIHKRPLDVVEEDDAEEKDASDDPGADAQVAPTEKAFAKEGVAEGFDDRGHRVQDDHPTGGGVKHRQRVNDRGGIHGQLDAKGDQNLQVAVFRGQRGHDDANT